MFIFIRINIIKSIIKRTNKGLYGKTLAYLSKCGMIAKANIAAFVVKNCKEREKL